MKAPGFWWREPGVAAGLLRPLSWIYGRIAATRMRKGGDTSALPVICIGNVTVGGSGKTPTVITVATLLRGMGLRPAFLTRGYGGRLPGPVLVDPARHGASEVGDEALLLAREAITIVARNRPRGAALALGSGADVIVMDDGLQNPSLHKDLAIAVFDGAVGIGNGSPLPGGPLRAPLAAQWPLIDAVLVIGPGQAGDRVAAEALAKGVPVFRGSLVPKAGAASSLGSRRVLAFAGIGRPEKFFDTLRACGAYLVETRPFPDHHPYSLSDVRSLIEAAGEAGASLVTTEKDWMRLAELQEAEPRLSCVETLGIRMVLHDPTGFAAPLASRIGSRQAGSNAPPG